MIKIISSARYRYFKQVEEECEQLQAEIEEERRDRIQMSRELKAAKREFMIVYGLFFVICILVVVIIENKKRGLLL